MRTAVACLVLAAAIATPGIVVVATSSSEHAGQFTTVIVPPTGLRTAPPINPVLRPAVRSLTQAFAKKGVALDAVPMGKRTVVMIPARGSAVCQTFIVLQTVGATLPLQAGSACPSGGSGETERLKFSFTPASIGTTIGDALKSSFSTFSAGPAKRPSKPLFNVNGSLTAVGYGKFQRVVDDPALHLVERALVGTYESKGVELMFLPIGVKTVEAFESGSGRCLVDIVLSTRARPQQPGFPACETRSTRSHGVWVTFAPPSAAATIRRVLSRLPR
jgi:hypothetical protein